MSDLNLQQQMREALVREIRRWAGGRVRRKGDEITVLPFENLTITIIDDLTVNTVHKEWVYRQFELANPSSIGELEALVRKIACTDRE